MGSLLPLYEPPFKPATLRGQYTWAAKRYGDHCIFSQVGSFCEFYGAQAERYGRFFGLKPLLETRMNVAQCGFPVRYLKEFKEKSLQAGIPYVVVAEQGFYPSGLKKRVVTEIFRVTPPDLLLPQGEGRSKSSLLR
jgi:DNA mismatch repair ATPase MutS